MKKFLCLPASIFVACAVVAQFSPVQLLAQSTTTAWHDGQFHVDVPGVLGRSDVVLGKPNGAPGEAMPVGNGHLGVAVWSADGLTAQLNRDDAMPDRLSPGQVVIPGLAKLTQAKDYTGRLDLYHGEFREHGGGMTATTWVEHGKDVLIVEVTGADPHRTQTAQLKLWKPRAPQADAKGAVGLLAESWVDYARPEASGRAFGVVSAMTAEGRGVSAVVTDALTVTVSFKPFADGHFRVVVAAPHFDGTIDAWTAIDGMLRTTKVDSHRKAWQDFWQRAAMIKISSKDGAGEYMENLRNLYLYVAAIEKGEEFPGTQAGIADMISAAEDTHKWDASAFWHWNQRMQVAANLGAGAAELNETYFNLYRENLVSIEDWTKGHMMGLPGACVPETMRFNGRGIEYESTWTPIAMGLNCDANFKPYYNARTISTGAEIALWVWRQYLATNDLKFLEENYPLMTSAARFLLAYEKPGEDGLLHTSPANAHETQWDVKDPTTNVAAIQALYPVVMQAAQLLGKDADLVEELQAASAKTPELPRTQMAKAQSLLTAAADAVGKDVIAESYEPSAEDHNVENIGLEPVWPYDLIGDASPLLELARRTYRNRPNKSKVDWSYDPIQAARLGLGDEVGSTLVETTEKFQGFVNGMAKWETTAKEFYVEQTGIVADALQEALVQDYDGVIRVTPALPPGWDFDGSVYVRGNTKVDVQTRAGAVTTVVIESGIAQELKLRNPRPGERLEVAAGRIGKPVATHVDGSVITFTAEAGVSYRVSNRKQPTANESFAPVSGEQASTAKKLGSVQIGLFK